MGWFSRSQPESQSGRRAASRGSQATEAHVAELRGKARRRLVGALVLVLTAVIFVPMLFDSAPPDESLPTPVVVPAIPLPESQDAQIATSAGSVVPESSSGTLTDLPVNEPPASSALAAQGQQAQQGAQTTASPTPSTPAQPPSPTQPAEPVASKPATTPTPSPRAKERTDDGSVAIALLEGRAPKSTPPEKGNFTLQIAAYGTEKDAQSRRERLVAAGVTNAYVEQAVSGGKTTYRLRVGPFPTRDAAQAAQARLRALGYDNGFISTQ